MWQFLLRQFLLRKSEALLGIVSSDCAIRKQRRKFEIGTREEQIHAQNVHH